MDLISSIVDSQLGPNKSTKIVQDDFAKCPFAIFQNVHFEDAFCRIVEETLRTHHEHFGCSTTSLLAMFHFWFEAFQAALREGCEMADIVNMSHETLEYVISSIPNIALSSKEVLCFVDRELLTQKSVKVPGLSKTTNKVATPDGIPLNVCYSSRHFSPFCSDTTAKTLSSKNGQRVKFLEEFYSDVKCVVQRLSHDDIKSADLVSQVWARQMEYGKDAKFNIDGILVCELTLPSCSTSVAEGVLLETQSEVPERQENSQSRTLLMKGSLTCDYIHLGFSPMVSVIDKKSSEEANVSKKETWLKECFALLLKFNVNILIVKERVDPAVLNFCDENRIFVSSNIPSKTWKVICKAAGVSPCTYLYECDEESIVMNLEVHKWPLEDVRFKHHLVRISFPPYTTSVHPHTVLLCNPSKQVLQLEEHQFWHVASRLQQAAHSATMLAGGGDTELRCSQLLDVYGSTKPYEERRVVEAVSCAFRSYHEAVHRKLASGQHLDALDDCESKLQAWRSGLALALALLQCDVVIINGVEPNEPRFSQEVVAVL